MTHMLRIAAKFTLPLDAVTTTSAIFGLRGSGKTNTAVVEAEELLEQHQQIVVIDPTDVWWGLKSSKAGDKAGYPIVVLGGRHKDLPLEAGDGPVLADFVVDDGASVILSLRHFESNSDRRRFITDFARRLYFRKGQSDTPAPVMVFIDEASLVVPQRVMGEDARMVGAIQQLVRQGRSSGIGVTLIDQRPATVNKDVLAMIELLIVHRVTSPQDRKALTAWIEQHDAKNQAPKFLESLAQLEQGEAWFWSPGWLDVFEKVKVRPRRTYDSSYTPKAGERVVAPTKVAELDLVALQAKLGATIEKARATDPLELQKRIRDLEAQLRKSGTTPAADITTAITEAVEVAVNAERQRLERYRQVLRQQVVAVAGGLRDDLALAIANAGDRATHFAESLEGVVENIDHNWMPAAATPARAPTVIKDFPGRHVEAHLRSAGRLPGEATANSNGISGPGQRILDAIAFYNVIGVRAPEKAAVAAFVGVSPKTGSWANRLSELRTAGLIEDPSRDAIALTPAGAGKADRSTAPRSLADLHDRWLGKLSGPASKLLRILIDTYPDAIEKSALAAMVGVSPNTGSWANRLSELRVPGLLEDASRTEVRASANLFPQGLR